MVSECKNDRRKKTLQSPLRIMIVEYHKINIPYRNIIKYANKSEESINKYNNMRQTHKPISIA